LWSRLFGNGIAFGGNNSSEDFGNLSFMESTRDEFKKQLRELRIAKVSYKSLALWLQRIHIMKKEGMSDQEITERLERNH